MTRHVLWIAFVPVALSLGCSGPVEDPKVALERAEAAAKEAGAMMSLDEIRKAVAVPDADNAWPIYQEAKKALVDARGFRRAAMMAARGQGEEFEAAWQAESKAIALLFEAVKKPGCDPKLAWEALTIDNVKEASDLGLWSAALGARAQSAAAAGNGDEAIECLKAMVAIARHVDSGGSAMALLNGTTYVDQATRAAVAVAASQPGDADLLQGVRGVLKELGSLPFPAALALRIDASLATRAQADPKSPARRTGTKLEQQPETPDVEKRSRALVLDRFVETIKFYDNESFDPRPTWLAAQAAAGRWDGATGPEVADADQFRPPMLSFAQGIARRAARVRCAETALEMIESRHKTGAWPAQPPTQREDPFNGQPLKWSVEDDTLSVWSVAVDGRDAGGNERDDLVVKASAGKRPAEN